MLEHRPAMKVCLPLIGGIMIGWLWDIPLSLLCFGIVALFTIIVIFSRSNNIVHHLSQVLYYVIILLLGMMRITIDKRSLSDDNISFFVRPEAMVRLQGKITDLPSVAASSLRFVVEAESVWVYGRSYSVSGGVLVTAKLHHVDRGLLDSLMYGRELLLTGELIQANTARNPGDFDMKHYLYLNNIYARLYVDGLDSCSLGATGSYSFTASMVYPVRRSIAERIDSLIKGDEAKFLKGLIIGERSEIPSEVKMAFINAGVMHILAVSGLHVAIVAMILLVLFQLLRIPETVRIPVTMVLLTYYIFLTGAAASVTRSVIMAVIFLGGKLLQLKSDMYNTLAMSAVVILLIDAKQLFQPGFQLSFVAVFSLVYFYPKIYSVGNYLPTRIKENNAIVSILAMFSVSLAAGLGTLPFTSIYFGKISFISFFANVVIVPLSNVILALGMLTVAISYFSTWLASMYASATALLTTILLKAVDWFANVPLAYIGVRFTLLSSAIFYATVSIMFNFANARYRRMLIIGGLVLSNIILYRSLWVGEHSKLQITFLDVGQGDAIFVEFPDGKNMLVDAGPKTMSNDAGNRFIVPYLRYRGISHLNAIVVSHPHNDHLGGVPFLLKTIDVGQVIDAGSTMISNLQQDYMHLVDSLRIERRIIHAGDQITGFYNARLYILHPSGSFLPMEEGKNNNLNNESLVIKLIYGQTALMLSGDAEQDAEERIVQVYGNFLRSDLLKVGHHGSKTSSSSAYLHEVNPLQAIVSVGARNKFHHPSPIILQRYHRMGCQYLRTDEQGAVMFESNGKQWTRVQWR